MALKYYTATNTGQGFITHEDNASAHIAGHPGNIWTTENTTWAARVGAVEKTFEEAQTIVSASISGSVLPDDIRIPEERRGEQITYSLPEA